MSPKWQCWGADPGGPASAQTPRPPLLIREEAVSLCVFSSSLGNLLNLCVSLFIVSVVITAPASGVPEQRVSLRGPPHAQSNPSHPEGVGRGGQSSRHRDAGAKAVGHPGTLPQMYLTSVLKHLGSWAV